jgi:rod shape-determining protein MreB
MPKTKILNVGIDFGTSRTVIAADNGARTFLPSYVGYPKDAISQKLLGGKAVFGDKALANRLAVDLHSPFERGILKYSNSPEKQPDEYNQSKKVAKDLLKHLINLVTVDEKEDLIIRAVIGAPAMASTKNKKALLEICNSLILDVMIVSEPFAVAYGLNLLSEVLIVDIGAGTVDMCRMHGTIPSEDDQMTTYMAGNHIDKVFLDLIVEKNQEANFTLSMIKKIKEENAFVSAEGESIIVDLPVEGKPTSFDLTNELRSACRIIVPDIVEGIQSLIASFDPEFQDGLKKNVILAGGGSQIIGLKREIENYLKDALGYGKVSQVEEPLYAGANGALMLCKDMPDEYWDELKSPSASYPEETRPAGN